MGLNFARSIFMIHCLKREIGRPNLFVEGINWAISWSGKSESTDRMSLIELIFRWVDWFIHLVHQHDTKCYRMLNNG